MDDMRHGRLRDELADFAVCCAEQGGYASLNVRRVLLRLGKGKGVGPSIGQRDDGLALRRYHGPD